MRLPHHYRCFEIAANMTVKSGQWQLEVRTPGTPYKVVRRYKPPMQHFYIGSSGSLAYDHDVRVLEADIDKNLQKYDNARMDLVPAEHWYVCEHCDRPIDRRDLGAVLAHGQWDEELGRHVCYKEEHIEGVIAKKVGDPIEWKDGKPNHLN
jgi:hypothetical protein